MSRLARSLLFVPGDRPDRFDKALGCGAHEIILDLEDAVSPDRKAEARDAVRDWLGSGQRAVVRINGADTPWFDDDVEMLRPLVNAGVMLPKAELDSVRQVASSLPGRQIIALIESVQGLFDLRQVVAVPGIVRMAFGSVDFGVDSGIEDIGEALTPVRTQVVLESCHAGMLPPIDGVSLELHDAAAIGRDAKRSRALGFGGKLCIHPRQVAAVNEAFLPSAEQLEWARRVMAANEASAGGVTSVDGQMVDKPVVEQARRILAEGPAV